MARCGTSRSRRAASTRRRVEQRTIPDYAVVDLSAGIDFGQFDLELYVKNLNNSAGRTSTTGTTVFGGFPLYPDDAIGTGVIRPRTVGLALRAEL